MVCKVIPSQGVLPPGFPKAPCGTEHPWPQQGMVLWFAPYKGLQAREQFQNQAWKLSANSTFLRC